MKLFDNDLDVDKEMLILLDSMRYYQIKLYYVSLDLLQGQL